MIVDVFTLIKEADRMERPFDFTVGGFGHELAQIAAEEMLANMDAESDPDGNPWLPLSYSYKLVKDQIAPGKPIGELFGVMKTLDQLLGYQQVWHDRVRHVYGTDQLACDEAEKFQEGGAVTGTQQPERPFWGFTKKAVDRMDVACEARFDAVTK